MTEPMNACRDCTGKQAETMCWQGFASDRRDMSFLSNLLCSFYPVAKFSSIVHDSYNIRSFFFKPINR